MLEIDKLSKRYGDTVALDRLSFAVRPGQMYGFVGTNGAGKTTAMRIVLGVLEADSGTVRWLGRQLGLTLDEFLDQPAASPLQRDVTLHEVAAVAAWWRRAGRAA